MNRLNPVGFMPIALLVSSIAYYYLQGYAMCFFCLVLAVLSWLVLYNKTFK